MKILIMILLMVGVFGCESTPMKSPSFAAFDDFQAGVYSLVKKGYNFNGVKLCFYEFGSKEIKIPSRSLDKWKAGRCPSSINVFNS